MSETASKVWIVQKDYGHEGHSDLVATTSSKTAEALTEELNARDGGCYTFEALPLVTDIAAARVDVLTLRQEIFHGGISGDYTETLKKDWSFTLTDTAVKLLGTHTGIEVSVSGANHADVREKFATALKDAQERAEREPFASRR